MTYKQKAIEACRQLAHKYRNPQGEEFFRSNKCSLCLIYLHALDSCRGCPLGRNRRGNPNYGCRDFRTYKQVERIMRVNEDSAPPEFIARAEFFEKIIPILEKIPTRRFTPPGWKLFKELDRDW